MCRCTSKLVISCISFGILACALFLFAVGTYMFVEYRYDNKFDYYSKEVLLPAAIIMGLGLCLLIMSLVGCVGAFKEHKCFLGVFATFLLIVIAGTITATVVTFVNRNHIKHGLENALLKDLNNYNQTGHDGITKEVDDLQKTLKCCGVHNASDWHNTPYKHIPDSCYENKNHTATNHTEPFQEGCYSKLHNNIMSHLNIIAGVVVAFIILLSLGVFFSCVLICRRRSEIPYIGLNEPVEAGGGMRV